MRETKAFAEFYYGLDKWLVSFRGFEEEMHRWFEVVEDEECRRFKAEHLQDAIYRLYRAVSDLSGLFEDCIFTLEYNNKKVVSETLSQQFSTVFELVEILQDRAEEFFNENPYNKPERKLYKDDCLSGEDYFNYTNKIDCSEQVGPFAYSSAISGHVRQIMGWLERICNRCSGIKKPDNGPTALVKEGRPSDKQQKNELPYTEEKIKPTSERPELNDAEQCIIEALAKETLTGEKLAKKAGYPYNSNFKSTLARLRKRAILGNRAPGYFIRPEYHYLLNKSD